MTRNDRRGPGRRAFLMGGAAAGLALGAPALGRATEAVSGPPDAGDLTVIAGDDPRAPGFDAAYNHRVLRHPRLRALCHGPDAVARMVAWARDGGRGFAVRSGGHCFEGFSQHDRLVIDLRRMRAVTVDAGARTARIEAGATIGAVIAALAPHGLALSTGFCQGVGIGGHALGGGLGFLSRAFGLTCDAVTSVEIVGADGRIRTVGPDSDPDLYWASRGGGGGAFGIATAFHVALQPVRRALRFEIDWLLAPEAALALLAAWSAWAPAAPREITSLAHLRAYRRPLYRIRCNGVSLGSRAGLERDLARLAAVARPMAPATIEPGNWQAISDAWWPPARNTDGVYKYKSGFGDAGFAAGGWAAMLDGLAATPPAYLAIMAQALGGAIDDLAPAETAYPHRRGPGIGLEFGTRIDDPAQGPARLSALAALHARVAPFMTGGAYVNYPDLDLADWGAAYWAGNYPRLRAVKTAHDPTDLFRHAQSPRPLP